ncbi:MAG: hypothetical protein ACO3P3_06885, partial [Candidatus Nanopelagicales bacterium]
MNEPTGDLRVDAALELLKGITELDAKTLLNHFLDTSLINFGEYQDAILDDESILFHSCLSSSLNIGLIT